MESQTGATMSLGKGSIFSFSKKQKLNTKSSTEAELVGVDDLIPKNMLTKFFGKHKVSLFMITLSTRIIKVLSS